MWCDAPRPDRRGFLVLAVGGVICPSGGCREATGSWLVSHVRLLPGSVRGRTSAVGRSLLVPVLRRRLRRWSTPRHREALYREPAVPQPETRPTRQDQRQATRLTPPSRKWLARVLRSRRLSSVWSLSSLLTVSYIFMLIPLLVRQHIYFFKYA